MFSDILRHLQELTVKIASLDEDEKLKWKLWDLLFVNFYDFFFLFPTLDCRVTSSTIQFPGLALLSVQFDDSAWFTQLTSIKFQISFHQLSGEIFFNSFLIQMLLQVLSHKNRKMMIVDGKKFVENWKTSRVDARRHSLNSWILNNFWSIKKYFPGIWWWWWQTVKLNISQQGRR